MRWIWIFTLLVTSAGVGAKAHSTQLTFLKTQKWLPHFFELAQNREKEGPLLPLGAPPNNDSEVTKKDLEQLFELQAKRSPQIIDQILVEKDVNNISYGEIVVDDHEQLLTPIGQLVFSFLHQSMGELFAQKKKFDRVRPTFLSQTLEGRARLKTLFETPFHPAYPSGHSFQGHGIALLIAEIVPDQAEAAICDATRLAVGREIAGVHYPSDSRAGAELAKAYMAEWIKKPEIKFQISSAAKWWKENRKAFLAERSYRKRELYVKLTPPCSLETTRRAILNKH